MPKFMRAFNGTAKHKLKFFVSFLSANISKFPIGAQGDNEGNAVWVSWTRKRGKKGATKMEATMDCGYVELHGEPISVASTMYVNPKAENGFDSKILKVELMQRNQSTGKEELLGTAEVDLSEFADQSSDHEPVDVDLMRIGQRVGSLHLQVEATDADAKLRRVVPSTGDADSPRSDTSNGTWDLDSVGTASINEQNLSGYEDSLSPNGGGAARSPLESTPRSATAASLRGQDSLSPNFQKGSQGSPGHGHHKNWYQQPDNFIRVYYEDGSFSVVKIDGSVRAHAVAKRLRERREAVTGTHENFEMHRLHQGSVGERMLAEIDDQEVVAKVISEWRDEDECFLIFIKPASPDNTGGDMSEEEDMGEEILAENPSIRKIEGATPDNSRTAQALKRAQEESESEEDDEEEEESEEEEEEEEKRGPNEVQKPTPKKTTDDAVEDTGATISFASSKQPVPKRGCGSCTLM